MKIRNTMCTARKWKTWTKLKSVITFIPPGRLKWQTLKLWQMPSCWCPLTTSSIELTMEVCVRRSNLSMTHIFTLYIRVMPASSRKFCASRDTDFSTTTMFGTVLMEQILDTLFCRNSCSCQHVQQLISNKLGHGEFNTVKLVVFAGFYFRYICDLLMVREFNTPRITD